MALMQIERADVGGRTWLQWVLASAFSGAVTMTVTGALVREGTTDAGVVVAVFGMLLGVSLGLTQWLVLRRQVPRAHSWVLASALGGMVVGVLGLARGEAVGGPFGGSVIGAALGIMQGLVLRRSISRAYVWVLASILAFALSLSAGEAVGFAIGGAVGWLVGGTILGVVVGAITGSALVWLLQQPGPER
jgi:hypothetical protein